MSEMDLFYNKLNEIMAIIEDPEKNLTTKKCAGIFLHFIINNVLINSGIKIPEQESFTLSYKDEKTRQLLIDVFKEACSACRDYPIIFSDKELVNDMLHELLQYKKIARNVIES